MTTTTTTTPTTPTTERVPPLDLAVRDLRYETATFAVG